MRSEGVDTAPAAGESAGTAGGAMVVAIGIAVAALRGMNGWLADRRQRFQDQAPVREAAAKAKAERIKADAEHTAAMRKIRASAAEARQKAGVQSPTDFGKSASKKGGDSKTSAAGSKSAGGPANPDAKKPPQKPPPSLQKQQSAGKTTDAKKAAGARREAKQNAPQRDGKKQGGLDRLRRKGGKDGPGADQRKGKGPGGAKPSDGKSGVKAKGRGPSTSDGSKKPPRPSLGKAARGHRPKVDLTKKPKPGGGGPPKVDLRKKPKAPKGRSTPGSAGPSRTSPRSSHTPGGKTGQRPWKNRTKRGAKPGSGATTTGGPGPRTSRAGASGTSAGHKGAPGSRSRRNRQRQDPPPQTPRADGEWLRPPPGMTATYSVTITRPDESRKPAPPAGITRGRQTLPTAAAEAPAATTTTRPTGPVPGPRKGARPMGGVPAVPDTQYTDADLTVYDVIESDEDMAQEVLAGADHARLVAERCERLVATLESLRAELIAKKVPGSLIGWCVNLIERAGGVESKAEGLAKGLPRASEAIAHAGQVAADYDKQPADVVRDMGHTAPADASYHQE